MTVDERQFHLRMKRFERRLPSAMARGARRIRFSPRVIRVPLALLLIGGGFLGFLPVLGFWMIPLGLLLLALDLPVLRAPMTRMLHWIEHRFPARS